jgi:phosphate-selective porin OprO and OprP
VRLKTIPALIFLTTSALLGTAATASAQETPAGSPAPAAGSDPAGASATSLETASAAPGTSGASAAVAIATDSTLALQIEEIDQRARIVERRLELLEEQAAQQKAATAVVTAGDRGFNFKSADGAFLLKVRGLIHADGREYLGDHDLWLRDSFLIRRARPLLEATFFDVADFRLMPDFGGGTAVVQDAYVDARPAPWLKLRAGKFKPPVGLERLQSAAAIVFAERAFPTSLAPNRDLGFMLHGLLGPSLVSYELGVFNGVVDGGSGDLDNNHAKDFAGRIFLQPWKGDPYSFLSNLGLGFSGSTGWQRGTAAVFQTSGTTTRRTAAPAPGLPVYRTAGQQTFFSYRLVEDVPDGAVIGYGRRTRLSPQGYFYTGPFGLMAEYIQSTQAVQIGPSADDLTHRAWQVAAYYVLGGKPLFEGTTVTTAFDPKKGTWGAFELGLRYNALTLDDDSFPTYADPARSAKAARGIGAVANWHWSRNIKLSLSFERTTFDGGAPAGADHKPEISLFQRIQAAF